VAAITDTSDEEHGKPVRPPKRKAKDITGFESADTLNELRRYAEGSVSSSDSDGKHVYLCSSHFALSLMRLFLLR
jgi:hypothetical protein